MQPYKKISEKKAKKIFRWGYDIYLVPSKCNAYPIHRRKGKKRYIEAYVGNIRNFEYLSRKSFQYAFDEMKEQFKYYNCDKQYGQHIKFYVQRDILDRYNTETSPEYLRNHV